MYDVFISYSRNDAPKVVKFRDELLNAGFSVWMDVDGIESGDEFKEKIANAISGCGVFLFFSSESSNASPWVIKELGVASHLQKRIIPIKLDQSKYSMKLLMDLVNLDYIDCSDSSKLTSRLRELIKVLKKNIQRKETDEYLYCPKCHSSQLRVKLQNSQWEKSRQDILDKTRKMGIDGDNATEVGALVSGVVMATIGFPIALAGRGFLAAQKIKKLFSKEKAEGDDAEVKEVAVSNAPSVVFICDKCGSTFDLFDIGVRNGE